MYGQYEQDRHLVDPARLYEVRFEDLVREPIAKMEQIYGHFGLGEFDVARPKLEAYFKDRKDYRTDSYQIPDELRDQIDRRWGPYMRRFGYCQSAPHQAAG
jgi:hypothetical protein